MTDDEELQRDLDDGDDEIIDDEDDDDEIPDAEDEPEEGLTSDPDEPIGPEDDE